MLLHFTKSETKKFRVTGNGTLYVRGKNWLDPNSKLYPVGLTGNIVTANNATTWYFIFPLNENCFITKEVISTRNRIGVSDSLEIGTKLFYYTTKDNENSINALIQKKYVLWYGHSGSDSISESVLISGTMASLSSDGIFEEYKGYEIDVTDGQEISINTFDGDTYLYSEDISLVDIVTPGTGKIPVKLYFNKSPKNYVNKEIEEKMDTSITFKGIDYSITNPTLKLKFDELIPLCNYLFIESYGRYYYIDNMVFDGKFVTLTCSVDVLMSNKETILNNEVIIERQEQKGNYYLSDSRFPIRADRQVVTKTFDNGFDANGVFILTIAGD